MKPLYRFLLAIVVCLVMAAGAYFWAMGSLDSLYAYRSPLKDQPIEPGERIGLPATRRVVFILVDALRYDTALNSTAMPTLARLRASGALAKMHSRTPSFSEAGYSTLLTGAWPDVNDGPAMNLDYADIPTWTQDNLFSAATRAGLKTAVSGYNWFEKLVPQQAVSAHFYTPGEDAAADRAVVDAALPWLDDPQAYQLILIHLDQVDYAGHHEGGPRSQNWTAAAQRSDALIGEILRKLDLSQDTILIASDHGQIDMGGHGGQEQITLEEPFTLAGAGVKPGVYPDIQMVDLAPTLAALLGLNLPASGQGQVQTAMLTLTDTTTSRLPALELLQQERLVIGYAAEIEQPVPQAAKSSITDASGWQRAMESIQSARLSRERLPRAGCALAILILLVWLVTRLGRQRIIKLASGVVVYLLVFNLRYAVLDGLTYSFSSVKGASDLIIYIGLNASIALLMGWLLIVWIGGLFSTTPGKLAWETLALVLSVVAVLALPVLFNFALNGLSVTWILPEPASFFVGLLSLIQILFVVIIGLILTGLSALVSWLAHAGRRQALAKPVSVP
jgi:hypothetical protein